jgi:hypothetical protein
MPVSFFTPTTPLNGRFYDDSVPQFNRHFYLTDRDGVEHEIRSNEDLMAILSTMTAEELALWMTRYRFVPITNSTKNPNYTGGARDTGGPAAF